MLRWLCFAGTEKRVSFNGGENKEKWIHWTKHLKLPQGGWHLQQHSKLGPVFTWSRGHCLIHKDSPVAGFQTQSDRDKSTPSLLKFLNTHSVNEQNGINQIKKLPQKMKERTGKSILFSRWETQMFSRNIKCSYKMHEAMSLLLSQHAGTLAGGWRGWQPCSWALAPVMLQRRQVPQSLVTRLIRWAVCPSLKGWECLRLLC